MARPWGTREGVLLGARGQMWECVSWGCGRWPLVKSGLELMKGGQGGELGPGGGGAQQGAGRRTPGPGPPPDAQTWSLSLTTPPSLLPQLLWKEVSWAARAASGPLGLRSTSAPSIARPCPLGHRSQGSPAPGSLQSKAGRKASETLVLHVLASPSGQWGKTLFGGRGVTYERQGSSPSMTSPTDH